MKLPVVLIDQDNIALASLRQQLQKELDFLVENRVHSFEEAFEFLQTKTDPVLVIVDLSRDAENAFRLAGEIKLKLPSMHLLMTSPNNDPQTLLQAMRAGAEEFITQPFNWPEVLRSLKDMREKIQRQLTGNGEQGRVITVFSSKGGVGSTTVAINLAVALAARQKSVCIVDLVLQFGSVTSSLNLEASYTILDLVNNLPRIDPLLLDGSLVEHTSGVRVLAEPLHAEDAGRIGVSDIDQILDTLSQSFNFVVVDTPKEIDEAVFVALEKAHLILFVTETLVPSLKCARRALESFERLGINPAKVQLILNRYVKNKPMSIEAVGNTLGSKIFWTFPNDYSTAIAASNQGLSFQEIRPRSKLAKSYRELANAVMEDLSFSVGQKPAEKKRSIFSRWIPVYSAK